MFFINNFFCHLRYREDEKDKCKNGCKICCPENCEAIPERVQQRYQVEIVSTGEEIEDNEEQKI